MPSPARKSVKVLLINEQKEILLMCAHDPKVTSKDGIYHGRFWFPIGGGIEQGETIQDTAIREIFEETSLTPDQFDIGPIVWHGTFDLIIQETLTHLEQTFIVVHTKIRNVMMRKLDEWEQKSVKTISWFSYEDLCTTQEIIYPVVLKDYLPDILNEKYPKTPLELDLGKQPNQTKQ
ncbi:MAG: NUDIX domain-containing protein [Parachlamydiales bacterium]|nr:NUDIX domain-containing protein [Parachlamydiales bacterium]